MEDLCHDGAKRLACHSVAEALGCQMPKVTQTQIQKANCQTPSPSETLHPKKAHDYQSHPPRYGGPLDNLFPLFAQQLLVSLTSLPHVQVVLLLNRPSVVEFRGFFQNLLCIYYITFAASSP